MLSEGFIRTQIEMHGEAGQAWLDRLPQLLQELSDRWAIRLEAPYSNLSFNYVAPGMRTDGAPIALKVGIPRSETSSEANALSAFDGCGAIRLWEVDRENGALLLERLVPGTMLKDAPSADAPRIAAGIMRQLWRPAPHEGFETLAGWVNGFAKLRRRFDGGTGPLPAELIDRGERLGQELLASATPQLLHGDLHHQNILRGRDNWLAIDPKGLIGDPAYEPAAFLANSHPHTPEALKRCIDIFSEELGLDWERIHAWSLVYCAMSAWWTIEDGGDWYGGAVELAERLKTLSR